MQFDIASDRCEVSEDCITAQYTYSTSRVSRHPETQRLTVTPVEREYVFQTATTVPKLGNQRLFDMLKLVWWSVDSLNPVEL